MNEQTMQRSELHLHTVASGDTSVISAVDAVQAATAMNYKALAVTDLNSVQSYYSLSYAHQHYGRDLKLIYGAELSGNGGSFTVLVKDSLGLTALYRLLSHKDITGEEKTHLLIGASHHNGELHCSVANGLNDAELAEIAGGYDYIELHTGQNGHTQQQINRKLYELGKALSIPVVAVGGCHYVTSEDAVCKEVIDSFRKTRIHTPQEDLSMRTTEEMLEAFSYLGEEAAYEVVVTNPNLLADRVEQIDPDSWDFPAFTLPDAEERVRDICINTLQTLYGTNPPAEITERLEAEIALSGNSLSLYLVTYALSNHIHTLGGMVGYRGSMGSTLISYLLGISGINPLPAHYRCPHCCYAEFAEADSGYDLPKKNCPHCGSPMLGNGHNIPYETTVGIEGDKVLEPDITVPQKFYGEAIRFLTELVGKDRVAYAGVSADFRARLAESYLQVYCHKTGKKLANEKRIVKRLSTVKKGDGIHPSGIVLLPEGLEWEDITPMRTLEQPACGIDRATHMDYYDVMYALPKINVVAHSFWDRLQTLFAMTGTKPGDVDYADSAVYELFFNLDTCGIPDCSSRFAKDVLCALGAVTFSDLVRVCGMGHGINTWKENAEQLLADHHEFRELISTREDVFHTLQNYGIDKITAYAVMENVRKGKFSMDTPRNAKQTELLEQAGVPQWYIRSMKTVHYLTPKAYVVHLAKQAFLAAWFKVYHPVEFYHVTLEALGARQYLCCDDEELEWKLESLSETDYAVAKQREAIELLIEARTRNIPINL